MRFLVDLHTHTVASDHAYSTIADYVRQAQETGIQMFATTDHGPSLPDAPHKWHFGNLRVIPHVADGIAILKGVEANITASGDIDLEEYYTSRLDIVLCGFHPNYTPTDLVTHTELMLSVIKSGRVDIITHPGQPKYPIDFEAVLECAKEHNVAIEINASSSINTRYGSHENCVQVAKLAKKIGNIVSLGSDAHVCWFMGRFDEAVCVIEEAGLGYDKVINTSPARVLDFLESRGRPPIKSLRKLFTPL